MNYRGKLSVLSALAGGEQVLIYVNGGGVSCVFSLGVLVSLVRANLNKFAVRYGGSGGALILAASISNPEKLESVLDVFEYLVCGGFLCLKRGPLGFPYPVFDIEELIQTLEGKRAHLGLPALDEEKIRSHPDPFRVAVTDNKTGKGRFLDVKPHVFRALRATASVQGACDPVEMNGREFSDGQVGMKIGPALGMAVKYVLVIMNRPPIEERAWWEQQFSPMLARILLASETPGLRKAAAEMDTVFSRGLRRLEACSHVETLVLYPNWVEDILPLTSNLPLIRLAYHSGMNATERLIERVHAV